MKTDYGNFYANVGVWQNTIRPEYKFDFQPSTVSFVTTHHTEDDCCLLKHYHAYVAHVHGFHGKGFMPCIRFNLSPSASMANGKVVYGTDQVHLDEAIRQANEICNRMNDEFDQEMQVLYDLTLGATKVVP
ncbi:MAG: hypothetical protein FJ267_17860 [Planctomycetes bacterium]|nr:hypothetical protein [Planctomycetota bacterium]